MSGILCLTGGIGGAKLALGLQAVQSPEHLTFAVNSGDDFSHLGLEIWPDFDTLIYTLSGLANSELGWGRADESWTFHETLTGLGGPDWFRLGDRDMALHALRTGALRDGQGRAEVAARIAAAFGVRSATLPAAAGSMTTWVHSDEGMLSFQDYFVRRRAEPRVIGLDYRASGATGLMPQIAATMARGDLDAVIVAPSNPWLSVAPILEIDGCRAAMANASAPVVAVTPIIGGQAVKGPTAKIMGELGLEVSALSVARFYAGLIDGFVLDETDAHLRAAIEAMGIRCRLAQTWMRSHADKAALAEAALSFAATLPRRRRNAI